MKKYLVKLVNQDIALLLIGFLSHSIEPLTDFPSNAIPIVESNLRTTNAKLELAKHRLKKLEEMEF